MSGQKKDYSQEEWTHISENLKRQLGPEYLAQRPGPSGGRLTYIEGKTAINIANDIFGFNGWSTEIKETTIDFVDVSPDNRYSIGVSVVVRITLKDGSFHEDIGYGNDQNAKFKGQAFEKARKQAVTDATKRTLRFFGNALGNCLYDNPYLSGIGKMAKPAIKFTPTNLYRHAQFEKKEAPSITSDATGVLEYKPSQASTSTSTTNKYKSPQSNQYRPSAQISSTSTNNQYKPPPQSTSKPAQIRSTSLSKQQALTQFSVAAKEEPNASATVATPVTTTTIIEAGNNEVINPHDNFTGNPTLVEPIIPEDSFSYDGDDAFFAQVFADGDPLECKEEVTEDMMANEEEVLGGIMTPPDVSQASNTSSTPSTGSVRRDAPLSDEAENFSSKRIKAN